MANRMINSMGQGGNVSRMSTKELQDMLAEVIRHESELRELAEEIGEDPGAHYESLESKIKALQGEETSDLRPFVADGNSESSFVSMDRISIMILENYIGSLESQLAFSKRPLQDSDIKRIGSQLKILKEVKCRKQQEINELKLKRNKLQELGVNREGAPVVKNIKKQFAALKKQEKQYTEALSKGGGYDSTIGMAAVRGLVGRDGWFIFQDLKPQSLTEGLAAGATYRLMNVVGNKLQQTIEREGGELWDSVIGGGAKAIKNGLLSAWYWLMHGNARPFTVTRLERWKQEVLKVVLDGLAKAAIDSQKNMSKGREAKMREMFDAPNADHQSAAQKSNADPTWQAIAQGYAQDLERLARRIEAHKAFYGAVDDADEQRIYMSERCDILAIATRLQETLRLIKDHIFEPSGSLQDLAAGDHKLLLPQLYKDIEQRFDLLIKIIIEYHGNNSSASPAKSSSSSSSSSKSMSTAGLGGSGFGLNHFG